MATGADRLCETLLACGVDTCFANPGTSEMAFVAALDRNPAMRCILGLFEGVVTGAADGYGRMADRPAATLLHTGPGLANGFANLHNARRAHAPMVNIVGDHASYHLPFDAPLTTDIDAVAGPVSHWFHRVSGPDDVAPAARTAYGAACAMPGIATLVLPGDAAWGEAAAAPAPAGEVQRLASVAEHTVADVAGRLRAARGRCGMLLSGAAARAAPLEVAWRIAATVGARLFGDMFLPRVERGRGRVPLARIPYPVDDAVAVLRDIDVLVLVGAAPPVAFFAYPGKPSALTREGAEVATLALPGEDAAEALARLADALGARAAEPPPASASTPDGAPSGPLDDRALTAVLARAIPENAVVVDEALTSVRGLYAATMGAAPHDYLMACTGGAIGAGPPVATGAAVACPDRKVLSLQADGSGMYTLQALWTQAREGLDVTTVIFANRAYAILQHEMRALGVQTFGRNAERMFSLGDPALDWRALARGMGVDAFRAETAEELASALEASLARSGPTLIEAVMP